MMAKRFRFTYEGQQLAASAEVFYEGGLMKYRLAFDSRLLVIREVASSVGSTTGIDYVQEAGPDEEVLPQDLIQTLGIYLEDINFFPDSFWVSYYEHEQEYGGQFLRHGNTYTMLYGRTPGKVPPHLPVIFMKEGTGMATTWRHDPAFAKPAWFENMGQALSAFENGDEKDL